MSKIQSPYAQLFFMMIFPLQLGRLEGTRPSQSMWHWRLSGYCLLRSRTNSVFCRRVDIYTWRLFLPQQQNSFPTDNCGQLTLNRIKGSHRRRRRIYKAGTTSPDISYRYFNIKILAKQNLNFIVREDWWNLVLRNIDMFCQNLANLMYINKTSYVLLNKVPLNVKKEKFHSHRLQGN